VSTRGELDRPEFEALWRSARSILERRSSRVEGSRVTLTALSDEEIAAICSLLGRRRPTGSTLRVDLAKLDAMLRAGRHSVGVIEVVERLGGPIRDRPGERANADRDRDALWRSLADHPAAGDDRVALWIDSLRSRGRLARLGITRPDDAIVQALDVLAVVIRRRPATHATPLPMLAAQLTGDAHALDDDRIVGQLVADAIVALAARASTRDAWLAFGVELDPLNSSVLTLGLPGPHDSIVDAARRAGEPLRLTSRMLRTLDVGDMGGRVVQVCENPSMVAVAADELGPSCAPLLCTDGMPKAVSRSLIQLLSRRGATIRAHADFDAGGVAIIGHLVATHGVLPWRFCRDDYLDALAGATLALSSTVGATPWDGALSATMNRTGRAVHEESLADVLLADLRAEALSH
jgi:uncharacterized protein (TIGR02679 family)